MNDLDIQHEIKRSLQENSYYVLNLVFIELGFPLKETSMALCVYCNKQQIEDTAEQFDCSVGTVNNNLKRFIKRLVNLSKIYRHLKLPDSTMDILENCIFCDIQ